MDTVLQITMGQLVMGFLGVYGGGCDRGDLQVGKDGKGAQ